MIGSCHIPVNLEGFGTECGAPETTTVCPFRNQRSGWCPKDSRSLLLVVALNHSEFDYYCRVIRMVSPQHPRVICISTEDSETAMRTRGRMKEPGDELVTYGNWSLGRRVPEVALALRPGGWLEGHDW